MRTTFFSHLTSIYANRVAEALLDVDHSLRDQCNIMEAQG